MSRSHHQLARERSLFDSTQCPCCLKEFHSHSKVLAHLRNVRNSRETLIGRRLLCEPVPGVGSRLDVSLHEATDGAVPFEQAQGPLLPTGHTRSYDTYDIHFLEDFYLHFLDAPEHVCIRAAMRACIISYPISWTSCQATLQQILTQLTPEDAEILPLNFEDFKDSLRHFSCASSWQFLQDEDTLPSRTSPASLIQWETWCATLALQPPDGWAQFQPLPASLTRYKILLHAFAGRRRHGDIEWFLQHLHQQHEGFTILTVSLDIVIDAQFGDISNPQTRQFWLHYIRQGFIAGFLAGPPCNTWSKARQVQLLSERGPRVIRTPEAPWGLESLRCGELDQLILGTILLGFALECLLAMALSEGAGLLEHPREPDEVDAVSIWRLPAVRMLLQLPEFRLVHLSQGLFGAPSPKPTTLLTLRLTNLETTLHHGMLTKHLPFACSTGRDQHGNFRTAPLKEYPPGLCRAIACSFYSHFCTSGVCVDRDPLPKELLDQCVKMSDRAFGEFIGRD